MVTILSLDSNGTEEDDSKATSKTKNKKQQTTNRDLSIVTTLPCAQRF
jgi:hypothetical protein